MQGGDLLETWVTEVNSLGTESAITLLVSGTMLTGFITPTHRYRTWLEEVASRAKFGERALPRSAIGPISERQSELARQAWEEAERDGTAGASLEQFCLRDVTMMEHGAEAKWTRVPFLVVNRSAVNAFSPVLIST